GLQRAGRKALRPARHERVIPNRVDWSPGPPNRSTTSSPGRRNAAQRNSQTCNGERISLTVACPIVNNASQSPRPRPRKRSANARRPPAPPGLLRPGRKRDALLAQEDAEGPL